MLRWCFYLDYISIFVTLKKNTLMPWSASGCASSVGIGGNNLGALKKLRSPMESVRQFSEFFYMATSTGGGGIGALPRLCSLSLSLSAPSNTSKPDKASTQKDEGGRFGNSGD